MIEYKHGDILRENAEILVNTVNCVGVMGRGIALQFKKAFPENFKAYAEACKNKEVQPGRMFVYDTGQLTNPRLIVNFPTKRHWRGQSRIEDIEKGLRDLVNIIRQKGLSSIAIPPLGCGLGGLEWPEVRFLIKNILEPLSEEMRIIVFEPKGSPAAEKMVHTRKVPEMTPGRAALIGLMNRYLAGLLDPFVTLLEIHKLAYFMQETGEPLNLKFQKGVYGPYAENLRHVLNAIEGHFVSGYADGDDNPNKQIELIPGAIRDAENFLKLHVETGQRLVKVSELVDGFETPFGLELLSTVHWIARKESVNDIDEIIERTYDWNEHKKQFTPRQINLAVKLLLNKGWI